MESTISKFGKFTIFAASILILNAQSEPSLSSLASRSDHKFVYEEHGVFGYRRQLSDVDRANGIKSPPLTLVRLQSRRGGFTFFSQDDAGNQMSMQCTEPCQAMRVGTMSPSGAYNEQVIPVDAGSVLASIIYDARRGYLDSGIPKTSSARAPVKPSSTPLEDLKAKLRQNHEGSAQP